MLGLAGGELWRLAWVVAWPLPAPVQVPPCAIPAYEGYEPFLSLLPIFPYTPHTIYPYIHVTPLFPAS